MFSIIRANRFKAQKFASTAKRKSVRLSLECLEDRIAPANSPKQLLDINTSANKASSNPQDLVAINGIVYFQATSACDRL